MKKIETIVLDGSEIEINSRMPVLPLKEVVFFPNMVYPLLVGREGSLRAIHESMLLDKLIFLTAQRDVSKDEPRKDDLYRVGVVARILQLLKLPNGLMKVLAEGLVRARIKRFLTSGDHLEARLEVLDTVRDDRVETLAAARRVGTLFRDYVQLSRSIPEEVLLALENIDTPERLADYAGAHIQREAKTKQKILEILNLREQLTFIAQLLEDEKEILEAERDLEDRVRGRIHRSQRNFWLQEQMKVIQEELGEDLEPEGDLAVLRERVKERGMSKEAEEKAYEEIDRLQNAAPLSPEATVIRNYVDWLLSLPWTDKTEDQLDITHATKVLDEDHYGLEKPKQRILEHLAVLKLVNTIKGPILCFVGPPGVGKTSLAKSIARAMNRKFVRFSLGGIRDEAEIRGHRRTYIGSMPGRIIQSMKKATTVNPVFLLDEIDKMTHDFHGDPAAALLEVLDPEQNRAFNDHYLEVDYDLSKVLFITTANTRAQIPEPLQDRMEIINLSGYLEHEKLEIAKGFLFPKQLAEHGLTEKSFKLSDRTILSIIREYTREAGVRNLERELSALCRKVAFETAKSSKSRRRSISSKNLEKFLGVPKHFDRAIREKLSIGVATGLAWTKYGGDILEIEVTLMPGKGSLILTGKLGDVMKESARAALSYARANAKKLGIAHEFWKNMDIHLHIPEGAIPKDGPSAGITLTTALISALTNRPVKREIALTGEMTLLGTVLGIGGLKEKILAAQRLGLRHVIIPQENAKDLKEVPAPVRRGMKITTVDHVEDVLKHVLPKKTSKRANTTKNTKAASKRSSHRTTAIN